MKRLAPVVALLVACLCAPGALRAAQEATAAQTGVVLIFDDSGSMAQKAGEQSRMELARKVTEKSFVAKLNLELSMGLVFLNRRDLCLPLAPGSAWVVQPQGERPGSVQKNEIMERIATIAPTGSTPLTEAVRTGRGYFDGKDLRRKLLVIVTDGVADDQASFLHEVDASLQARVEVYAIGFCLDRGGQALRDKLNAGGATRFFDATGTAASLTEAFQSVLTAGKLESAKD